MMRLKFAITFSPLTNTKRLAPDMPVTFAPMEAIQDGTGGLDTLNAEKQRYLFEYFEGLIEWARSIRNEDEQPGGYENDFPYERVRTTKLIISLVGFFCARHSLARHTSNVYEKPDWRSYILCNQSSNSMVLPTGTRSLKRSPQHRQADQALALEE